VTTSQKCKEQRNRTTKEIATIKDLESDIPPLIKLKMRLSDEFLAFSSDAPGSSGRSLGMPKATFCGVEA